MAPDQNSLPDYETLIIEGIKDLPREALAEIAYFVYIVRKQTNQSQLTLAEEASFFYDRYIDYWAETESSGDKQDLSWSDIEKP